MNTSQNIYVCHLIESIGVQYGDCKLQWSNESQSLPITAQTEGFGSKVLPPGHCVAKETHDATVLLLSVVHGEGTRRGGAVESVTHGGEHQARDHTLMLPGRGGGEMIW